MPEAPVAMREPAAAVLPEAHREGLEYIERVTAGAAQVQRRVLAEILAQNAPAEYLRRLGVVGDAPGAVEAFLRAAPLVTYEDILPDVLRIANGDTSPILSGKPIREFLTSMQLRHVRRGAEADAVYRRRDGPALAHVHPAHAGDEPGRPRAGQGEVHVPLLRQGGVPHAGGPPGAPRAHELLPEPPLPRAPARPLHRVHEPRRGRPLRRLVPEHVRAAALRPRAPRRRAPRRRRLRLGLPPRHPLPGEALAAPVPRHPRRHARRRGHRPVRARRRGAGAPRRPGGRRRGRGRVREAVVGGHHPEGVAQHQVHRRHRHRRHGAVHPHAGVLRRRPAADLHHVRLLRVLLRHQPQPDVQAQRRRLHPHPHHGLLRVPPRPLLRRQPRRRAPALRPRGPRRRQARPRVRARPHRLLRAVPVSRGRRAARGGLQEPGAHVQLRAPQERGAEHRLGQDRRGGAARGGGPRGAAPGPLRRVARRVHELRRRGDHPGPLRALLGAPRRRRRRDARAGVRVRGLLPRRGGGPEQRLPPGPRRRPLHRAAGDPRRLRGHLRQAHGLRARPRRVHQPVQGAPVRAPGTTGGAARRPGAGQVPEPQVPQVEPRRRQAVEQQRRRPPRRRHDECRRQWRRGDHRRVIEDLLAG